MPTHKAPPPQGLETVKASIAGLRKVVEGLDGKAVGSKSSGSKAAIKHATTTASLLFLDLKAANRETLEAVEIVRNSTSTGKQSLDRTRLQLQNVLYEKTHVEKEIRTSKDFKSAYDDAKVGLVAIETFKKEFKKHAEGVDTSVDLDSLDAHALELRRLSHELATRKKLVEQKDALEKKLKLLKRDVATKNSFLSSLRNNLQNVQRSIEPLSKQLSNSESNKVLVYERRIKSKTLPVPMYVLFSSLVAAADSVRESITVDVEGSVADAEAMERHAAQVVNGDMETEGYEEEIHSDDDEKGETRAKKSNSSGKRKRADADAENAAASTDRTDSGESHPLRVTVTVNDEYVVTFRYLPKLRVITAEVNASDKKSSDFVTSTLVDLFPGDDGASVPNPSVDSTEWDVTSRPDRPYRWAQHIAGLDYLPVQPPFQLAVSVSPETVAELDKNLNQHASQKRSGNVLRAILDRLQCRQTLDTQLHKLLHSKNLAKDIAAGSDVSSTLRSIKETFGDDDEDTSNYQSGSVLFQKLKKTGSRESLRKRGARRVVVEVAVGANSHAQQKSKNQKQCVVRAICEIPAAFPIRNVSFGLSALGVVGPAPPASEADAGGVALDGGDSARDACNDLRVMEEEVNGNVENGDAPDAVLRRSILKLLTVCDRYPGTSGWGGAEDAGARQGRERRKA